MLNGTIPEFGANQNVVGIGRTKFVWILKIFHSAMNYK